MDKFGQLVALAYKIRDQLQEKGYKVGCLVGGTSIGLGFNHFGGGIHQIPFTEDLLEIPEEELIESIVTTINLLN